MTIYVAISKNSPNLEVLDVLENRDKSYKVRNKHTNDECFIPKSGLTPRNPDDESYAGEYVLKRWFRDRLSYAQERALGIVG